MKLENKRTRSKRMKRLIVTAILAAAIGGALTTTSPISAENMDGVASTTSTAQVKAQPKKAQAKKGTRITTGNSAYGTMLFDRNRQAIYLFDLETSKRSQCYGACAKAWPPVLTKGRPLAKGKARQNLLGTTKRQGGATQVTYKGQPLYFYAHEGPGQVFCHDIFGSGGTWLVVKPNGKAAD